MLSVIVYGRNDQYGYNLHKRAALSLNAIAAHLSGTSEIIFVDYATPDTLPTFPEAIRDTLTAHTKNHLRILRVRPSVHQARKGQSPLQVIEPLARNVALRRVNTANRWVLSTNTDIIPVMRGTRSLEALVAGLSDGFYQTPRIEVPESVWEDFDRADPDTAIAELARLGRALHLDEIVYGAPHILFDGPGDFQLMPTQALKQIGGFDETMVMGWHVDANIARRMQLLFGHITPLHEDVFAYHCDHTREVTAAHKPDQVQNDQYRYVWNVQTPDACGYGADWGLAGETLEEISLRGKRLPVFENAIKAASGPPATAPYQSFYTHETYGRVETHAAHVMPYLADLVVSLPRTTRFFWFGLREDMRARAAAAFAGLGFASAPEAPSADAPPDVWASMADKALQSGGVFVFDFGWSGTGEMPPEARRRLGSAFVRLICGEQARIAAGQSPRLFVAIDSVHGRFEHFFADRVAATITPFSTRLRHGYATTRALRRDLMPGALVHAPATLTDGIIHVPGASDGITVFESAGLRLGAGRHTLRIRTSGRAAGKSDDTCALLELTWRAKAFKVWKLSAAAIASGGGEMTFALSPDDVDDPWAEGTLRIRAFGANGFVIQSLEITGGDNDERPALPALPEGFDDGADLTRFLRSGDAGSREGRAVVSRPRVAGHMVFGPYWPVTAGRYAAVFAVKVEDAAATHEPLIAMEVASSGHFFAQLHVNRAQLKPAYELAFEVTEAFASEPLELRVWSAGLAHISVTSIRVRRLG
jgi:hypothetical protein